MKSRESERVAQEDIAALICEFDAVAGENTDAAVLDIRPLYKKAHALKGDKSKYKFIKTELDSLTAKLDDTLQKLVVTLYQTTVVDVIGSVGTVLGDHDRKLTNTSLGKVFVTAKKFIGDEGADWMPAAIEAFVAW